MMGSTWKGARAATMRDVVQKSKMVKQRNMRDTGSSQSSQSKVLAKGDAANHGMQEGACADERRDDDESAQINDSSTDRIIVANTSTQSSSGPIGSTIVAPSISLVQSKESHNSSENSSTCYIGNIYDDEEDGANKVNDSFTYIGSIQVDNSRENLEFQGSSDSSGTCYIGSFSDDAIQPKPAQMAIRASISYNSSGSCYIGSFSVDAAEKEYKQLIKPKKKNFYGKVEHDQRLAAAKIIQTVMRVFLGRQAAFERLCAILIIQSFFRRWRAERHLKNAILSAVCIQKVFRGWFERDLVIMNWVATRIQALIRGVLTRWRLEEQEIEMPLRSAVKIQAYFRGWHARRTRRLLTRFSLWNIKEKEQREQRVHFEAGKQTPNGLIIEIPVDKVHERKKSDGGWDNRTEIEARMKSALSDMVATFPTFLSPKKSKSSTDETAPMALGDIIHSLLKPLSPNNGDGWLSPTKGDAWLSPTNGFSATEALDLVANIIFPVSPLPPPPHPAGLRLPRSPKVKPNLNAVSLQLPSKVIIVNESTSSVAASIRSSDYDDKYTDSYADEESRSSHSESYDSRSYYSGTETSSQHITYSDTTRNQERLQTGDEPYTSSRRSSRRMSQSPEVISEMKINRQRLLSDGNTYSDASNRQLMSSLEESYQDERDDKDTGTYERSVGSFEDAFSFHGYSDNDSQRHVPKRDQNLLPDPPTTLSPLHNSFCDEIDESIRSEDKEINIAIVKKSLSIISAKQVVDKLCKVKKSRILSAENEQTTSEIISHQSALQSQARIRERYQKGTTELFRLIQDERWEDVCSRVKDEPSEAKDWVVRSGKGDSWTRLPLHEACLHHPPLSMINSLLSAYPESAMTETAEGELPLHLATNNGADCDVVNCLLAWHPMAVFSPIAIHKSVEDETIESNTFVTGAQARESICESMISESIPDAKSAEDDEQNKHERNLETMDTETVELSQQLEQEDLTAMQLAMKIIQLQQVALKLNDTKTQCREMILLRQNNTNIDLSSSITNGYTAAIEELKEILRSSRDSKLDINDKIQSLELSILMHLREEEEGLVAAAATKPKIITAMIDDNIAKIKKLMKLLKNILGDTEQKKDLIKVRIKQLGVVTAEGSSRTLATDVDIPEESNESPAAEISLGISPRHMRWPEGVEHKSLSPSFVSAGRVFESFFGEEDEPMQSVDEEVINNISDYDIRENEEKNVFMRSVRDQVIKATSVVKKSQEMISQKLEVEMDAAQLKSACVDEESFDDAAKKGLMRLNNAISQFMMTSKASTENDGSVYSATEEGIEHSASLRVPYSVTSSVSYISMDGNDAQLPSIRVLQTSCESCDEDEQGNPWDEDIKESASITHEEVRSITRERVEENRDTHYDETSTNVDSEVVEKALALVERFRQQRALLKTMCLGVDNASTSYEILQPRSE